MIGRAPKDIWVIVNIWAALTLCCSVTTFVFSTVILVVYETKRNVKEMATVRTFAGSCFKYFAVVH